MIIDITIKDNNGTPLHHIVKNLDDEKETNPLTIDLPGLKQEFKDFLDMYLSDSGRFNRERLMPGKYYFNTFLPAPKIDFHTKQGGIFPEKQHSLMNNAVIRYELSFKTLEEEERYC